MKGIFMQKQSINWMAISALIVLIIAAILAVVILLRPNEISVSEANFRKVPEIDEGTPKRTHQPSDIAQSQRPISSEDKPLTYDECLDVQQKLMQSQVSSKMSTNINDYSSDYTLLEIAGALTLNGNLRKASEAAKMANTMPDVQWEFDSKKAREVHLPVFYTELENGQRNQVPAQWILDRWGAGERNFDNGEDIYTNEDVAWFFTAIWIDDLSEKATLSEKQLITLIEQLPDASRPIAILGGLRIIDEAAKAGKAKVVEYLLDRGEVFTSEAYVNSTLDYMFQGLSRQKMLLKIESTEDTEKANLALHNRISPIVEQVNRLIEMGAKLAPKEVNQAGIVLANEHGANNGESDYWKEQRDKLKSLGVNVEALQRTPFTPSSRTKALASEMKRREALSKPTETAKLELQSTECKTLVREIKRQIEMIHIDRDSFNSDSAEAKFYQWYDISPLIPSCYLRKRADEVRMSQSNSTFQRNMMFGEIPSVEEMAVLDTKSDVSLERLMHQYIQQEPHAYQALLAKGVVPETFNFNYFNSRILYEGTLRVLIDAGFDIYQLDTYGRSLLYLAAKAFDLAALKRVIEQNVPYYSGAPLPDPLYLWLQASVQHFNQFMSSSESNEILVKGVILLMGNYEIDVNKEHLELMQVLRLMRPQAFEEIVGKFDVLQPTNEQARYFYCPFG